MRYRQYYTHIIWDFNGTVLNDVTLCLNILNGMLSRRNVPTFELEEYKEIFGFPIRDYYTRAGFDFTNESYETLAEEYIEEYVPKSLLCPLYDGIRELLSDIRSRGISQILLSASDMSVLDTQLETLGIRELFDTVLGLDNIYAHSKTEVAKQWLNEAKPYRAVLIGDTTHDYKVARELGIDCILLSCGHHSYERLQSCGVPVYRDIKSLRYLIDNRPKAAYRYIELPENKRVLVTSDIHGNIDYLKGALCAAGYNANDILIINGDLTERGCNSLEVIRYIMELSEKNTVYTVMGNVDHFIYLLISDPGAVPDEIVGRLIREKSTRRIVHEMCQELGIKVSDSTNIGALRRHFAETYKREVDFLRSLPTIIETQSFVLAHGGIAHEDYRELDAFCCMKNDRYMEQGITLKKPCIVGHWPTPLYNDKIGSANPVYDREKRIISIDGGCELNRDGQLNMLVFPSCYSSDFTYVAFDNMETVIALDRQKENHDTLHIRFGHNDVKILNPGEEYSLIRHLETGREMEVYNKYLFESDGQDKCDNYSDYLLDVYPGDTLKVTYRTTRGIIAKKDGISGHYIGRIKE